MKKQMMKTTTVATMLAGLLVAGSAMASNPSGQLAKIRSARVVPVDDLGDDVGVAKCLAAHLSDLTPIQAITDKDGTADAVFKVSAHLPSTTTKMVGVMGGSPSGHLFVELSDGTKLWDDGAKFRRSMASQGQFGNSSGDTGKSVECGLADELLNTLRDAMRQARDKK